ncbi:ribosomal protein S5 domain 2-like protein [Choiromyces venosus 120613-1]|uniref:Ribosomal protein S5 domain 2-like protein n=1 Tax=Choiromyces venosus 120613-1 TaxID=1336337 RepID=A0A3N4JRU9_9PEZI|nr:ribosomal protein S5 domain 2-like protein [Choiromyces venosus 120613-1]
MADGSAQYTDGPTTLLASVNGPIEVKARDEIPLEAFLEITIRPSAGVTSVREKHLEALLRSAISPLILRTMHPRTLLQITLQIIQHEHASSAHALHTLLASAIVVAMLALVDAGVPMKAMLAAAFVEDASAGAAHVFGYTITGAESEGGPGEGLVFVESDGVFDGKGFVEASEVGRKKCLEIGELMKDWVRGKAERDMRYRLK